MTQDCPNNIYKIRTKQRLTLQQLADRTNTTTQQIQRLERGHRKLTEDWMRTLGQALNVPPWAFFKEFDSKQLSEPVFRPDILTAVTHDIITLALEEHVEDDEEKILDTFVEEVTRAILTLYEDTAEHQTTPLDDKARESLIDTSRNVYRIAVRTKKRA